MLDRLVNLRDLGGLPLAGGGATRPGVLYRSDAPYDGDAVPYDILVWPPATVIDLRSSRERKRVAHAWPSETIVHHLPLHNSAAPSEHLPPTLAVLYETILRNVPGRVARLAGVVAKARGPVLVHCAAGKDRTGIAVAALLLAAGVETEAVVQDYVATSANMDALRRRWQERGYHSSLGRPIPEAWLLAPEDAIASVVERLVGWRGGAAGWLLDHGAARCDIDAWCARIAGDN